MPSFLVSVEVDETELSAAVTSLSEVFGGRHVGVQRSYNTPAPQANPKPQSVGAAAIRAEPVIFEFEPVILRSEPRPPTSSRSEAMRRAWETRRANKAAAANA